MGGPQAHGNSEPGCELNGDFTTLGPFGIMGGYYGEREDEMTVKDLEVLFDYGYWTNKQLFGVLSQLSAEQFTQPVAGSYGSVRNTMVHILSAEWG